MNNLPYFFLLLKKNIALWTLIATGSFSKIDTAHIEYYRMSPHAMTLKNYSLSKEDTFNEIWVRSGQGEVSINFETSNPKYLDSMRYYFGANSSSGSLESGYTINGVTFHNSSEMLDPIDIGLDRKAHISLMRSGEHEYKVMLMFYSKNYQELGNRFMDSVRRADSAMYGLRGQPPPYLERIKDSAMNWGYDMDRRFTEDERKHFASGSIEIIDKAIKADSTYLDGYQLKFGWETELRQYDNMIVTGKKVLKLTPDSDVYRPETTCQIGEAYELTGKADSAKAYYQKALMLYDQQLSKEDNDNIIHDEMYHKAIVLILLNREQEGRTILKELCENTMINKFERQLYQEYFETPRAKFIQTLKR